MEDTMNHITRSALISLALVIPAALGACTDDPAGEPALDLAGRWQSACVDPGNGQALRLRFDLTAATWGLDYESFGDAGCAAPTLTVHIEGPYDVTGASAAVADAYEARFGFTRKTVTPRSDGAAAFLAQACGGGSFTAGAATDISAGCAGLGMYPIASCAADYDLVARTGDHLQFGARPADNDMCTEDRRPTALSPILLSRE
jgi:hypothetical protein